jgi:hypothetical protein
MNPVNNQLADNFKVDAAKEKEIGARLVATE